MTIRWDTEWDFKTITLAQWTNLVGDVLQKDGVKLYGYGGHNFKCLTDQPPPSGYHRLAASEIWSLSKKIFRENPSDAKVRQISGRYLIRNMKALLLAESERLKKIKSAVLPQGGHEKPQGELKKIEKAKKELAQLEGYLNPSSQIGQKDIENAFVVDNVTTIRKWIAFGADLNKPWKGGYNFLSYILRKDFRIDNKIIESLIAETDVLIKNQDGLSTFNILLNKFLSSPSKNPDEGQYLLLILKKFHNAPREDRGRIAHEINHAFSLFLMQYDIGTSRSGAHVINKILQCIEMFSILGANINEIHKHGLSLLALSLQSANRELSEKLIKMGIDVPKALKKLGLSKLMFAAWKGDLEAVKRILTPRTKTMLGNAKDKQGNTALIWAVRMGHIEVVKYLISLGVNVNAKNKQNMVALTATGKPEDYTAAQGRRSQE